MDLQASMGRKVVHLRTIMVGLLNGGLVSDIVQLKYRLWFDTSSFVDPFVQ